jgi:PadR family transcriptional regulator PadR
MVDTQTALLQALLHEDGYGLELIDRVRTLTLGQVKLVQGRVYPVLRDLESRGMLRSYEVADPGSRGGRPRRYYAITGLGRKAAEAEAQALRGLLTAEVL